MTDQTETPEQPRTLKVFTCFDSRHDNRSCYALVEDAPEPKRKHREWHLAEENGNTGLQKAVKSRDEEIAQLRQDIAGYRQDVAAYEEEVSGFHGEVQRVETPTPAPSLEINRDGYGDDELDDEEDEDEESPAATPGTGIYTTSGPYA